LRESDGGPPVHFGTGRACCAARYRTTGDKQDNGGTRIQVPRLSSMNSI
jgi:hypothetical protein